MTDDEKLSCIEAHHRVKFKGRPSSAVINNLFNELSRFNRTVIGLIEKDPGLAEKIERTASQKKIRSRRPRLVLIENMNDTSPSEFQPQSG